MALNAIFDFLRRNNQAIAGIGVDVVISEQYTISNTISSHPVENGANINDHIQKNPFNYNVTGVVSDTPLGIGNFSFNGVNSRRVEAFQQFQNLMESKAVFNLITGYQIYENMVAINFNVENTIDTGNALSFSLTMQQVRIVNTFTVPLNEENVALEYHGIATSNRNLGQQQTRVFQ